MKRHRTWIFLIGVVTVLACRTESGSSQNKGATDTNSNWLVACDDEASCGDELDCVCGLCSRSCDDSPSCADLGSDAACIPVASCSEAAICGRQGGMGSSIDAEPEPDPTSEPEPASNDAGNGLPCSRPVEDYLYLGDGCEVDADCDMFYDECGCGCLPENGTGGTSSSAGGAGGAAPTSSSAGGSASGPGGSGGVASNAGSGGDPNVGVAGSPSGGTGGVEFEGVAGATLGSGGAMDAGGSDASGGAPDQGQAGGGNGGGPSTACATGESSSVDSAQCDCVEDDTWSCNEYVSTCDAPVGTDLDVVVRTEYGSMPFDCFEDGFVPRPIHSDEELEAALCNNFLDQPSGVDWSERMMFAAVVSEGQALDLFYVVQSSGVVHVGVRGDCGTSGAAPGLGLMFVELDRVDSVFVQNICPCPPDTGPGPEPSPP